MVTVTKGETARLPKKRAPVSTGPWIVYVLRCAGETLYAGITNNLEKRLKAHRAGRGAKYTRGRLPLELVYQEQAVSRGDATRRERRIKSLGRSGKLALIAAGSAADAPAPPGPSRAASPALDAVLRRIRAAARPDQLAGMARYGIVGAGRLGLAVPDMRRIAKETGRDHALALALWRTGIPDARIVAALVAEPGRLTEAEMEEWVADFASWDVCDQVCTNLFGKSPLAWKKIRDWAAREGPFVRRAAFASIAALAWHDREAPDQVFRELLPLIRDGARDERNPVKKSVSWALRNIGKRNARLNRAALAEARRIRALDSRSARWVAGDAIRELESAAVRRRLGLAPG